MDWLARLLPVTMCAFNVVYFVLVLIGEGRVKPNVLRFAFMYAATIGPAARGDLGPFFAVFTMPPA